MSKSIEQPRWFAEEKRLWVGAMQWIILVDIHRIQYWGGSTHLILLVGYINGIISGGGGLNIKINRINRWFAEYGSACEMMPVWV